jgi:hypothetical protein
LVRLLKPWSFRRGSGLTTAVLQPNGAIRGAIIGQSSRHANRRVAQRPDTA